MSLNSFFVAFACVGCQTTIHCQFKVHVTTATVCFYIFFFIESMTFSSIWCVVNAIFSAATAMKTSHCRSNNYRCYGCCSHRRYCCCCDCADCECCCCCHCRGCSGGRFPHNRRMVDVSTVTTLRTLRLRTIKMHRHLPGDGVPFLRQLWCFVCNQIIHITYRFFNDKTFIVIRHGTYPSSLLS